MLAHALQSWEPKPLQPRRRSGLYVRVVDPEEAAGVQALVANVDSPEALLHAVAARQDRQSFLALFRHFAPRVKAYLRRQGADSAVADDLAQEVMFKVWRRAVAFDAAKASAATWVYAIARNAHIDAFRRTRRPEVDMDDAALVADSRPLPDDAMAHGERAKRVQDALASLPAEQATIVRMSFFLHKSHAEIAKELALPLGTVKSRLRLAFGRLRDALHEDRA
ncbi:MAG: sigma-70 family RNA polymerase sigma factor [Alphaproteobacteria bacterium]|nr:sigma-70 family RNA polymerase sigma factor [Alphaproteobacteria bacterium]